MIDERILTAVERIDGALSRIETAALRPAPTKALPDANELEALRARHAEMRGRVEAAMGELDMLIRNG